MAFSDDYHRRYTGIQPGTEDGCMPIAIIGMGGRFPGDASSPEKLWELVYKGRSALSEVPKDRFNVDAFYHPHHERQGTLNVRKAHFMESDISEFDAPFFSITLAEAKAMDPQQRVALECTYEAFENGGQRLEDILGSKTSCYIGCFTRDYSDMLACDRENLPLYHGTGTGSAIMSNRISWYFDLKGPSISLDTACSSSLVALHLGCQSLRTGESEMSVVGGTNLILLPDIMSAMTSLHFLSPDGKCQSFDHKANGYSRGEGAAIVILKPLHLALRDNDVIRAVIRGTAVNQDGNTPGITLPSATAQESLIRETYRMAGLGFADTAYVEAHGTGTPAGDPVEAQALAATFGKSRSPDDPVYIGSIKTNIGHLEGGSGLAQVVKAVFALENGEIPPSLWFEKQNDRIRLFESHLAIPTTLIPWPRPGLRRLSINSFGYAGTNAHCILDDAYHYLKARRLNGNHNTIKGLDNLSPASSADSAVGLTPPASDIISLLPKQLEDLRLSYCLSHEKDTQPQVFIWTSHEQLGIGRTAQMYSRYLSYKSAELDDIDQQGLLEKFAYTLAARRSILPWKSFVVASTPAELAEKLGETKRKPLRSSTQPKLAFVFTGQGAQWSGMGRELLIYQVFRESLEDAGAYLVSLGCTWSLISELLRDELSSRIDSPALSQPICTAVQVALVDLMRHWNVNPCAVVGHSSGEIAAAYAKGAISKENAWLISYHRGRLSGSMRGIAPDLNGSMLAVGLGLADVEKYLPAANDNSVVVACINSPNSVTLSGNSSAIQDLESLIQNDGHFARRLKVETAYHSPHMQVIAKQYLDSLSSIMPQKDDNSIKMFSTVTGELVNNSDLISSYWVANLLNPVNFLGAVQSLCSYSQNRKSKRAAKPFADILIEIGPHSALQGPINQTLSSNPKTSQLTYISLLRRGQDASISTLEGVGALFTHGYRVDIARVNSRDILPKQQEYLVDVPAFSWNRQLKYCLTVDGVDIDPRWRNIIRLSEAPWIEFHKVQGSILYPAAGMMVAAIEAAKQQADPNKDIEGFELRDIIIGKAIVVPADDIGVEMVLSIRPWRIGAGATTSTWQEFTLYTRQEGWDKNCSGLLRIKYKESKNPLFFDEDTEADRAAKATYYQTVDECRKSQNPRQFYEHLTTIGLYYGDVFQNMVDIRHGHYKAVCSIQVPDTRSRMPMKFEYEHVIHPATLDSIIQMALPATTGLGDEMTVAKVPTSIDRLYVSADVPSEAGSLLQGYARVRLQGFDGGEATVAVSTPDWKKPLVVFDGTRSKSLSGATDSTSAAASLRKLTSYFHWKEDLSMLRQEDITMLCTKSSETLETASPEAIAELELGAFIIIKRVLAAIDTEEANGLTGHYRTFYQYMQRTYELGIQGKIPHQQATPTLNWLSTNDAFENELLERVSKSTTDGAVMCQHGIHLVDILRGKITPLEVLMKDGLLHNFYSSGVGCPQNYSRLSSYLSLLAHKSPDMKILEIGAGTGGATLPVLEALGGQNGTSPMFSNYTFTDISSGFFEKAQVKLKSWAPFMTYSRLNIEEDPVSQGLVEGGYDVIIASNVLHATHCIDTTLKNVKKMLKPSGKLVLSEITNPLLRATMIVGSLEGWWVGEEDGRKWGPVLTESEWNEALLRAGYTGVNACLPDWTDPLDHFLSVLVSSITPPEVKRVPTEVIIIGPESPSEELERLSSKLERSLRGRGAVVSAATLKEAALAGDIENKSFLALLECEPEQPLLADISPEDWNALKTIILQSADITWVSRGATNSSESPFANLMTGMARSIRAENPQVALTTLDIDAEAPMDTTENVESMIEIFIQGGSSKHSPRPDWEYAIRNGRAMVQRILMEKGMNDLIATYNVAPKAENAPFKQEGRPMTLSIGTPGRLDTLQFVDDPSPQEPLKEDDVEIEVKGVGLNFKDIMVAMGQLQQLGLGIDASGTVSRVGSAVQTLCPGDRVMTWRPGAFSNFLRSPVSMVQKIPEGMDFATAASLPVVYSTAYYALYYAARLLPGETVLIHGAAGGVGQAAIILAQHIGAEIFATVSSEGKKALLVETYNIPDDHIFYSRDIKFAQGIKRMTGGKGVNVVLNSLAGESLRQSWHCIRGFGRFIEMGQKDIVGNTGLDMAPFIRNVSFHSINMLAVLDDNLPLASKVFTEVVELLQKGIARRIEPLLSMPFTKMEEAFRLMQTGQHIGKIVLQPAGNELVPCVPPRVPPYRFNPNATYVLAGGSGGLGRALGRWMVEQGARNIVFLSRSALKKPALQDTVQALENQGARVTAYACDVSCAAEVESAAEQIRKNFPPVKGVIQGAMVLMDAIYQNMTHEQFMGAIKPKVQGSWNLHKYLPQDMDFYVLLSSSVGIAGSRGQGNYSAGNVAIYYQQRKENTRDNLTRSSGNSFQDALAHYRQHHNQHGVSIDVGMVLGVGFLADTTEERVHDNTKTWSFIGIREKEFLGIVQAAITGVSVKSQRIPPQLVTGLGTGGMMAQGAEKYPWWFNDAKFSHLVQVDTHQVIQTRDEDSVQVQEQLSRVTSVDAASEIVCEALVAKLAKSMMMPVDDIEHTRPVSSYGVDSLLAVELRGWIFTELQADVSVFDLLSNIPISMLARRIVTKSKCIPDGVVEVEP
ncbi:type I Iterative Polyketide synthase (PKS) [Aspergillus brasiliensis]|uniref:Type I Iterative Polyketide synthase (PKS) n=1 Tax=Aspergillus brasiliensis TaxID=319629 RepID=A0A9W5Z0L3_9EURO|nr:type I Iterative Polyketide synthase (PKS) [Aspergillus brasiliensis]GKZ49376.1 type I Iterative Polyketide synthase (PKS) [Aspergillus brasiliensis]